MKNINIRKIKSDKTDAYNIALLYRIKNYNETITHSNTVNNIKKLCSSAEATVTAQWDGDSLDIADVLYRLPSGAVRVPTAQDVQVAYDAIASDDDAAKAWLQPRVNQSGEESYASWLVLRTDETGAYTVVGIGRAFE